MRVLIIGDGQLGTALRDLCFSRGHELIVFDRQTVDIEDEFDFKPKLHNANPDLIFHTAALTKVNYCEEHEADAYDVNSFPLGYYSSFLDWSQARLIYFSTDYVFPGSDGKPLIEDAIPDPLNVYGASKLSGEQHVLR